MTSKTNSHLEILFSNHYQEWCLLAFSYLENQIEAEEVVQDVCVKVLLKGETTILNLEAYMFRAIKNNCFKRLESQKKFQKLTEYNNPIIPSAEENIIFHERKLQIQQLLEVLPKQCKQIFELCVIEGQKYHNVAETLGISVNTVKYHIKNAYKILRVQVIDIKHFMLMFFMSIF